MPVDHPRAARRALGHVAITGVAVAILMSGCAGSDPKPTAKSTTYSASTSSSSATPSSSSPSSAQPLVIPDAAKKHTDAGAKAFAAFFARNLGKAAVSGDPSTIRALSLRACEYCRTFVKLVTSDDAVGQHQDIDTARIAKVSMWGYQGARPIVNVYIRSRGSKMVDRTGATIRRNPPRNYILKLRLEWRDGAWAAHGGAIE